MFGLTGGIGSGKSTVAARFRERGLPVIDADELARAVVARGTPGLSDVVRELGPEFLTEQGELDRKKVAALVFFDPGARRKLNRITHPRVAELSAERMQELARRGDPLACYEVPLLVEAGLSEMLRPLVVVRADPRTQIRRTMARDGATEDEARARVLSQMPIDDKAKLADYVVDNEGTREATLERADEVLDSICRSLGVDPDRYPG